MKIRKSIGYAYPTSRYAKDLGVYDIGGYFVEIRVMQENHEWSTPRVAQGHDVFTDKNDPDLISLFNETDGEICPHYLANI